MPNYTQNLELFKYDVESDGKQSFNINQCLNENWNKIDSKVLLKPSGSLGNSLTPIYVNNGRLTACSRSIPDQGLSATISLSSNGYIKFSNSVLFNWGVFANSASTITYGYSHTNTNYAISISQKATRTQENTMYAANIGFSKTNSGCSINVYKSAYHDGGHYITLGY